MEVLPLDEANRRLIEAVHPSTWKNPTPEGRYNLVVVGGGTAGLVTAIAAAGLGGRVALVERGLLGGDCLNAGCVPSKALLRAAHAANEPRQSKALGVKTTTQVDFAAVMRRLRKARADIAPHDSAARVASTGVDVFLGQARFVAQAAVEVEGQRLEFTKAVIATGSRPNVPPIDGLRDVGFLTNESVFSLTEQPGRLAVIGGGPIGCELAQAFARLGSDVTLIGRSKRLLPRDDDEASSLLRERFEDEGIRVLLGHSPRGIEHTSTGKVIHLSGPPHALEVDEILVATGRHPQLDGLGLEAAGVEFDERGVRVDDFLRTTNRRIYAAGDVCSRFQFTHAADAMARLVVQNALFWGRKRVSTLTIPWATYTDPEIAHVGLSHHEAEQRGDRTYRVEFSENDRLRLEAAPDGFARATVRGRKSLITGATIVGQHAGELIGQVSLAMNQGFGITAFASTVYPYPTRAEALKRLGDEAMRARLTPSVATILRRLLAWQR